MLLLLIALVLAAAAAAALGDEPKAYRLRGAIVANAVLDDVSQLAASAQVVVNGGERRAFIQSDGAFVVDGLSAGDSLLEISSAAYAFPKLHVRIAADGDGGDGRASVAARYVQAGAKWDDAAPVLPYPLQIAATARYDFYTPRQGFSIVAMFSNPYMLMVGASLAAVFILPRLQANMDPEALKEATAAISAPAKPKPKP
ncbi:hypothetical protein H4R18_001854 [Coemansia javaensis]|uniref:ER membrane protein complex subunit 7 beta-sandwich domain-containing protein n=1 Tax=Coemansia javaensis TaxID=2761396 RepID=A0A9W8LJN0_9FUNG|nr:hypothetical protein H4R18_001854 [Coemansia javaensis]